MSANDDLELDLPWAQHLAAEVVLLKTGEAGAKRAMSLSVTQVLSPRAPTEGRPRRTRFAGSGVTRVLIAK